MGHKDPAITLGTYTHAITKDEWQFLEELGSKLVQ